MKILRRPVKPAIGHGVAVGASLAMVSSAYEAIGGFADIGCGEDREIIRRLKSAGLRILHANDTIVYASRRLEGRAAGGMSDAPKARVSGVDFLVDDFLSSVRWFCRHLHRGDVGVWPPTVADANRVWETNLCVEIQLLENLLAIQKKAVSHHTPGISVDQGCEEARSM